MSGAELRRSPQQAFAPEQRFAEAPESKSKSSSDLSRIQPPATHQRSSTSPFAPDHLHRRDPPINAVLASSKSLSNLPTTPQVRSETKANRCNHLIQRPFGLVCASSLARFGGGFLPRVDHLARCRLRVVEAQEGRSGGNSRVRKRWWGGGRTEMKDDTG